MAVKSISMPDAIKEHLDAIPNASAYVVDLIKRDMETNKDAVNVELERLVKGLVEDALKGKRDIKQRSSSGGITIKSGNATLL